MNDESRPNVGAAPETTTKKSDASLSHEGDVPTGPGAQRAALPGAADHNAAILAAAHRYIERGWFPVALHGVMAGPLGEPVCTCVKGALCRSAGKHPLDRGWTSQAVPDLAAFERSQPVNLGVVTGNKSGFFVIDVDTPQGWKDLQAMGELPATYSVKTGGGGFQLYYSMPPGLDITNRDKNLPAGVDVRGNGGMVVVPPSRSGKGPYSVRNNIPVNPAQAWLQDALTKPVRPAPAWSAPKANQPAPGTPARPQTRREAKLEASIISGEVQRLADLDQPWHEGARWDATVYEVSCQLVELANAQWSNLTPDEALALVVENAPSDAYWNEAEAKFASARTTVGDKARPSPSDPADVTDVFSPGYVAQPTTVATASEHGQLEELETLEKGVSGEGSGALSDAKLSKRFAADVLKGRAVYLGRRHGWRRWNSRCWEPVEESAIVGLAREYFIRWHASAAARGAVLDVLKALSSRLSAAKLEAVVRLSKDDVRVDVADFDAYPDLLNVANGVVDLTTGALLPHDPALLLTKITPTRYVPGATHPDWTAALDALPDDCPEWFQSRCGQGITGHPPSDDTAVITVGGGSDGKTVIYGTILATIGQHGAQLSDRVLSSRPADHPTELAEAEGVRFAIIEELPAGQLNAKRVKDLVGTPDIKARRMYEDSRGFACLLSLFVTTNHLPQVTETEHGTWRRLLHLAMPYRYVLPPAELGRRDRRADEDLKARLRRGDSGQHEAVLAWLVAGARPFYTAGHRMTPAPASVTEATAAWRRSEDRVHGFLDEHCVLAADRYVHADELWQAYRDYATTQGRPSGNAAEFVKRLTEHDLIVKSGVTKRKKLAADHLLSTRRLGPPTGSFHAWFGIAFKADPQASDLQDSGYSGLRKPFLGTSYMGEVTQAPEYPESESFLRASPLESALSGAPPGPPCSSCGVPLSWQREAAGLARCVGCSTSPVEDVDPFAPRGWSA